MIKQYFQQALYELKAHPLLSAVSVIGTALAICLIMVLVVMRQVKVAPFYPETNRDRTLYVKSVSYTKKNTYMTSNGFLGISFARTNFRELTTPEAVTVYSYVDEMLASIPASSSVSVAVKQTDEQFWKVFKFIFTDGRAFNEAESGSGIAMAVITEKVARELFGRTEVAGERIFLNFAEYTVCGVVKDVSEMAVAAYAQIWVPYYSTDLGNDTDDDHIGGPAHVAILAHDRSDFSAIRQEAELLRLKFVNSSDYEISYYGQPDSQEVYAERRWTNRAPDMKAVKQHRIILFVLLLLIPAINLSSMTQSRLRQRIGEIGLRRSFGSTRFQILWQVLMENLILTTLAALAGLAICFVVSYVWGNNLFASTIVGVSPDIHFSMLMQPATFGYAVLFCLVLNLLSTGLPAWKACRMSIVIALNSK